MRRRLPGQSLQGHEVNLHPSNARQRHGHRQRSSITSPNSSISSYSPPWIMTPRPQQPAWTNGCDYLAEEPSLSVADTAVSTWQDEAHWMSFRNAVHDFASAQSAKEETPPSTLDGSRRTRKSETSYSLLEHSPPVGQVLRLERNSDHSNSFLAQEPSLSNPSDVTATDTEEDGKEGPKKTEDATLRSMASDLAETKMRLALVQAERDELEFALLMEKASESRSLSLSGKS